jgi:hypothetical protein
MNPLFEMMANMQKGAQQNDIAEQMAKQFGLQQKQAQNAIEALMPAFTQGLKRNAAATPGDLASFMQALASGDHASYLQDPMKVFTKNGMNEGNAILGHLFGNKEISRAVAKQAEATSGVSEAILKQMLPALAPLVMGGLFKQMAGQNTPQEAAPQMQNAFGGSGGILGQILQEMMKGGLGQASGQNQQQPRAKNPLEQILEQMTGGASGGQSSGSGSGGNLGDIFQDMIKNGPLGQMNEHLNPKGRSQPGGRSTDDTPREHEETLNDIYGRSKSAPEPEAEPKGYPNGTGLEDLFGDLFKPTKTGAPQYDKAIESIFDQFLKPKR